MAKKKRRGVKRAGSPAQDGPALSAEEQAARREAQRRDWAAQKRARDRAAGSSMAPYLWIGGGIGSVIVVAVVAILLIGGGGDSDDGGGAATPTPDPRIGNATPVETFTIIADDDGPAINPRFEPNVMNARAGEVYEVIVRNEGESAHNLNISGDDKEYDTTDDWRMLPALQPGDEARMRFRIAEPGTVPFRCDLHPDQQVGNVIVS
jgi:hypothetical protein